MLIKKDNKDDKTDFLTARIPEQWKTSIIIPNFKKDGKQVPECYRAITLSNTLLKVTTQSGEKLPMPEQSVTNKVLDERRSGTDAICTI